MIFFIKGYFCSNHGENHKVEKKVAKNLVERKKCAIFAKFENTNEITS